MKASSYLQPFDDVELAVRQRGSGMPLVWGHALLGSIRVDDQADIWQWDEIEKHVRLVRYDARATVIPTAATIPGITAGAIWQVICCRWPALCPPVRSVMC